MATITIGIISDIHANLPALQAVLKKMGKTDYLICAGDIVGYNGEPLQAIDILKKRMTYAVAGNHDYTVSRPDQNAFSRELLDYNEFAAKALVRHRLILKRPENKKYFDFLQSLKPVNLFKIKNKTFLLVHGTPNDPLFEYFFVFENNVTTHDALTLEQWLKTGYNNSGPVDVLIMGHTHIPFVFKSEHGIVLNPGSVGQPRDGDPRASFAILKINNGEIEVSIQRVEYDIDRACEGINKLNLPKFLCSRLYKGK